MHQDFQKLNKLEKEMQAANSKTKNLEEEESQIIENYAMKEGTYKILITVYEANDLQPRAEVLFFNPEKSACDAFIEIEVRGITKKTNVRKGTNNPIFQESFNFTFEEMSIHDLDREKIIFRVYDKNVFFIRDSLIGTFQLDWTNAYFRRFHQIYRGWLTLSDPNDDNDGQPVGYLLVNIAVLGPQDKIQVHDSAFIKDPLTTIEDTITNPKTPLIDYSLVIDVYRAQNLIPLDLASRSVDAYVVAKFSGNKINTKVVSSLNPEWNQSLKIGTGVPNKTKYVTIQIWNRNYLGKDDLIGSTKIPFIDIVENENPEPRWLHFYGPPMEAKDVAPVNYVTKMQIYGDDLGSHYRGRLLLKVIGKKYVHTKNGRNPINFHFPLRPAPVVALKSYTLSIELLQGFQLPIRKFTYVHVGMGQYMIKSKLFQTKDNLCEFMTVLDERKVQFAQDPKQLPDIIIYFCDGLNETNRICFVRIKASEQLSSKRNYRSKIYQLKGDKALNKLLPSQIAGFICCRVNLYTQATPLNKAIEEKYTIKDSYRMIIFLYKGEGFPPANLEGDCDPFVKFNFYGTSFNSRTVKSSFHPFWNQKVVKDVKMQNLKQVNITKGLICELYDHEDSGKHQFIGNFMVTISSKNLQVDKQANAEFYYKKPKWYYIVNSQIQIGKNLFGKVLLSFVVIKESDMKKNLKIFNNKGYNNQLIPMENEKLIQIFGIGLRDIRDQNKKLISNDKVTLEIKIGEIKQNQNNQKRNRNICQFAELSLKKNGCEINEMKHLYGSLPKNKSLNQFMDFKVLYNGKFYGYNSINIYQILPKLKLKQGAQNQNNEQSEQTILDVEGLQAQMNLINEKKKNDKIRDDAEGKYRGDIENINPPLELGYPINEENEKDIEFNDLIKIFQQNYSHPEQNNLKYVLELEEIQKRRDKMQVQKSLRQSEIKINLEDQNQIKQNALSGKIDLTENQLLHKKSTRQPTISLNNKYRAESSLRLVNDEKETIFDKMKKEIKPKTQKKVKLPEKSSQVRVKLQLIEEQSNHNKSQSKIQKDEQVQNIESKKRILEVNSQKQIKKDHSDLASRFSVIKKADDIQNTQRQSQVHFEIKTEQEIEDAEIQERAIHYKDVERAMNQEIKDQKEARQKDEQYKFANAVKLSLFGWMKKKKRKNIQTYQDYDTQEGEDLNIIPQWYKGRKILTSDLQDILYKSKKIVTIPLYSGSKIDNTTVQLKAKDHVGKIKMIFLSQVIEKAKEKEEYYKKLLKPKDYFCRIYILKGKSLISGYEGKPSTYLKFTYGDQVCSLKDQTYKTQEQNPQYYIMYELPLTVPGPCNVKIEVMETHNLFGKFIEKVLGYTEIDIEDRYFMRKWHLYQKKPIELRNLYSQYGVGSQGRLETWIDLIEKQKWISTPAHKIHPPPFDKFQLRIIVWKTEDCVYKNVEMESNDIYVRGTVGTSQAQETDTHWACRETGNFNYRFKFEVNYPPKPEDMYSDIMTIQIWDRDIIGFNNLIGQRRINLNQIHRIIQKAVKRKKPVQAKMKVKEKNFQNTDRFWFDVYNNKQKDQFGIAQPQGRVQLSFELVPDEKAQTELKNGYGRSEPNVYPTLPQPAGRLSFDLLNPLGFIKQIIGPTLYKRWCCRIICCLLIAFFGVFGYIFLPALLAAKI